MGVAGRVAQQAVWNSVVDLVDWTLASHESCVMSYGHTNTGKTHTIIGMPTDPGVLARSLHYIFRSIPVMQNDESVGAFFRSTCFMPDRVASLLTPPLRTGASRCGVECV